MDDKVQVSIEKINNGYILKRSWTEKSEDKDQPSDYKSEEHFMKTLPEGFSKYMVKGELGEEPPKDMDEADDRADYILNKEDKEEKE